MGNIILKFSKALPKNFQHKKVNNFQIYVKNSWP